jgi:hypothetical protein
MEKNEDALLVWMMRECSLRSGEIKHMTFERFSIKNNLNTFELYKSRTCKLEKMKITHGLFALAMKYKAELEKMGMYYESKRLTSKNEKISRHFVFKLDKKIF